MPLTSLLVGHKLRGFYSTFWYTHHVKTEISKFLIFCNSLDNNLQLLRTHLNLLDNVGIRVIMSKDMSK